MAGPDPTSDDDLISLAEEILEGRDDIILPLDLVDEPP